jgi:hypothetical protein
MDTFKKVKKLRRRFRFLGFVFTLVGGTLFISGIGMLLDPESIITCNGVRTNSQSCKIQFTTFSGTFLLIGLGFLFAKKSWLNQLVVWQESMPSLFKKKSK